MQKNKPVTSSERGGAKTGLPVTGGVVNKMDDSSGSASGNAKKPGRKQPKETRKR